MTGIEDLFWPVGLFSTAFDGRRLLFGGDGIQMHDRNGLRACIMLMGQRLETLAQGTKVGGCFAAEMALECMTA